MNRESNCIFKLKHLRLNVFNIKKHTKVNAFEHALADLALEEHVELQSDTTATFKTADITTASYTTVTYATVTYTTAYVLAYIIGFLCCQAPK